MIENNYLKSLNRFLAIHYNKNTKRFLHTQFVVKNAYEIGNHYKPKKKKLLEKLMVASLVHDYCKNHDLAVYIDHYSRLPDLKYFLIFHSLFSSKIIKDELNIKNRKILACIRHHTIGKPRMNFIEKVLYMSDYIDNCDNENKQEIKDLALKNLNAAVYLKTLKVIEHLENEEKEIYDGIYKTLEYYKKYYEN